MRPRPDTLLLAEECRRAERLGCSTWNNCRISGALSTPMFHVEHCAARVYNLVGRYFFSQRQCSTWNIVRGSKFSSVPRGTIEGGPGSLDSVVPRGTKEPRVGGAVPPPQRCGHTEGLQMSDVQQFRVVLRSLKLSCSTWNNETEARSVVLR